MRVLVLTSGFPKTSETFIYDTVTRLLQHGVNVNIAAHEHRLNSIEKEMFTPEIASITYRFGRPLFAVLRHPQIVALFLYKAQIWKYLYQAVRGNDRKLQLSSLFQSLAIYVVFRRQNKFDSIHAFFGPNGIIGSYLKELGIANKLLVSFLGYDLSRMIKLPTEINYSRVFLYADKLLPISEYMSKKLIQLGADPYKVFVNHIGIDTSSFFCREKLTHNKEPIKLISVARLTEKKGIKYAIQAVHKILTDLPDKNIVYDIIGDGELASELKSLVIELNLDKKVIFHGSKSHDESMYLMTKAGILLAPSVVASDGDEEGIPVVIMEALAIGLPVISTNHAGIPELITDKVHGFLVKERDSKELAESIARIVSMSENELSSLVLKARKKVETSFNSTKIFSTYVESIRS